MNGEFPVSIDEIKEHISRAEILSLFFPILGKALVVDSRTSPEDGPFIQLLPMAESVEDRLLSLKRLRPRFPRPRSMVGIPWMRYVSSLERLGVWEHIVERLASAGYPGVQAQCRQAWRELVEAEKLEMLKAIRGEDYRTLWQRE